MLPLPQFVPSGALVHMDVLAPGVQTPQPLSPVVPGKWKTPAMKQPEVQLPPLQISADGQLAGPDTLVHAVVLIAGWHV